MKTNAARILDRLAIAYSLHDYEVDESDLSAEAVARSNPRRTAETGLPLPLA